MSVFTPTLPNTMQAARIYEPGKVVIEAIPTPQPGPGELIVQVASATTCGTDLKTYRRGHPVLIKSYPSGFGHEGAGWVAAVGEGVTAFKVGDRVVAANSAPCQRCFYCQKGKPNLCDNLDLLNGTYAQYLRVPAPIVAQNTYLIPDHVSFDWAALTEPLAVCVRGIEACHIQPGMHVAVIGVGAIGQFLIRLAKAQGATVVAMGRNAFKRDKARHFGQADTVLDITNLPDAETVKAQHTPSGQGFDVVIEAVGQPHLWEWAIELVQKGGLVNLFGGCASGTRIKVDTRRLHYDELTLISLFHHTPKHIEQALGLLSTGTIDPSLLLEAPRPLTDVVDALEAVGAGQAIKIPIHP